MAPKTVEQIHEEMGSIRKRMEDPRKAVQDKAIKDLKKLNSDLREAAPAGHPNWKK